MDDDQGQPPILTAVSSSARQLYLLLRCIAFSEKAHVQITAKGLKFSVDDASAMEVHLGTSLFTTYTYHAPPPTARSTHSDSDDDNNEDPDLPPTFQISLPSLLETLLILGLTDPNTNKPPWARDNATSTAFSNNVLGINNMCRISYESAGSPLSIILTESSIRTTCSLTTYEPDYCDEIPFDREQLRFKTIMRGNWLGDAINELASTTPESLTLVARMTSGKPYFALSASGPLGSARVEFNNTPQPSRPTPAPTNPTDPADQPANLLETFQLSSPITLRSTYKFSLIQKAARAMSVATKVSIRLDNQGVLSMQFMIEVEAGELSFVDFRFVPLVEGEGEYEDETMLGEEGEEEGGMEL
ncbi:DNA repair exonuclease rad1 [Amniculicola lignicola CBS 123094]|uniref:DNA repair exonuclease rad1 n=1 Tax=Amniculicola lignicola CBS 123094 TaxID=1392246 RepID=A0A6A5X067_9PLEO|nr:DNA repair exonuclease rad1 [Amniculicola lignicola CBS 123094]